MSDVDPTLADLQAASDARKRATENAARYFIVLAEHDSMIVPALQDAMVTKQAVNILRPRMGVDSVEVDAGACLVRFRYMFRVKGGEAAACEVTATFRGYRTEHSVHDTDAMYVEGVALASWGRWVAYLTNTLSMMNCATPTGELQPAEEQLRAAVQAAMIARTDDQK